jgi:guanosine-3',5'-bis(diphosphate) 3'-pyrophosphohydrolase
MKIKGQNIFESNFKSVFDTFENSFEKDRLYMLNDLIEYILTNKGDLSDEQSVTASEVSEILLSDIGGGIDSILAIICFFIFHSEEIDVKTLEKKLGGSTIKILKGLYKYNDLKTEKIHKQTDLYIKLLLAVVEDIRAILILIAIHVHKSDNYKHFSDEEKHLILNQTSSLFVPLTHRIGLYNIKTKLEEFHMKHAESEMYRLIVGKLNETKAARDAYIENFITPVKKIISEAGYKVKVKGRPKSIHSIWNKMKTQSVPFEEVYDLFAVRIVLKSDLKNEKAVCWNVYSIITDVYKPHPKRLRDWISFPKLSGYESLHTTVLGPGNQWVEVQIRTERMDEIAEKGTAAHWRYKTGKAGETDERLAMIRDALENPAKYQNVEDRSKATLYSDDIIVFTPDGDLIGIGKEYTVLDFAFQIHTKVGETCNGAIVNGKIQPLTYELKNGDTIKILTNKNKKPNLEWLEIAKGTRTKTKIKRALKTIEFNSSENGKEMIRQKLDRLKIEFSEKNIELLMKFFNKKNPFEFYHDAGEGNIDLSKIKNAFEKPEQIIKEPEKQVKPLVKPEKSFSNTDFLLIDETITRLDYTLSKCCNPLPGDTIFGFVTVNKGSKIHKENCSNAKDMRTKYPYRIVSAKWNIKDFEKSFAANIYITGRDTQGITSDISAIVTKEFNLQMHAISLKLVKDQQFEGLVSVRIKNKKQITDLINRLKMLKGISSVVHR